MSKKTQEVWEKMKRQIQMKVTPNNKKFIHEMNLEEALAMEQKYIKWFNDHGYREIEANMIKSLKEEGKDGLNWYMMLDNIDHRMAIYKYHTYLVPRIRELQWAQNVKNIVALGKPPIEGTQLNALQ